jgi:clan AA aspartic protease (TIGR02281 family)
MGAGMDALSSRFLLRYRRQHSLAVALGGWAMRDVGRAWAAAAGLHVLILAPCSAQSPAAGDLAKTLARLSIDLPTTVTAIASVRGPLEQLARETCDQDAILHLGAALDAAGYRREAAIAQVNFSSQCGGYAPALRGAINTLLKLSDYTTAETVAADLIRLEPFSDNGYFLRALARDGNNSFKGAIDDYVTAIELFGNKDRISSIGYYRMARDYERLGRFCDAMLPIEQWVALDPSRHDNSRVQAMLSDYAAKGGCAAATSGDEERFPAAVPGGVVKVPVVVNNVPAIFILDTGAAFVALKDSFAKKAKVEIEPGSAVHLHTANGIAEGQRGRADTVELRSLKAKSVPVVVEADSAAAYGDGIDGLLGLSFLSRFSVTIDGQTVRIAPNKPR